MLFEKYNDHWQIDWIGQSFFQFTQIDKLFPLRECPTISYCYTLLLGPQGLYLLGGDFPALVLVQDVDIAACRQTHSGCVRAWHNDDADLRVVQVWHLSELCLLLCSLRMTYK